MPSNRCARLLVKAVVTACAVFVFEIAMHVLHPAITIWTSHFVTITFVTTVVVTLSFVFQRRVERSQRELIAESAERRKAADQLLLLQAAALEAAANTIVLTDAQGTILRVNPAFTQMTGYAADEAIGNNPRLLKSGKQDAEFYAALWNTITAGNIWRGEIINRKKDGSLYTEEMTIAPVRSNTGEISHYIAIKQDITQRKLAEQALHKAEQKYRSIFENAILGIFQATPEGEFLKVNPALARMAGYDSVEDFLNHVDSTAELYVDLKRRDQLRELVIAQKEVRNFEVEFKTKDGSRRTTSLNVRAMADREGTNVYLEGTVQDITERKAAEARIEFLAYHDALTGLPNRLLFEDRLGQALANARRREEHVAVLWLDLDKFKTINDSLGHSIGDLLLKQIAERLQKLVRAQDTVAKVGGDEFVFALINPGHVSHSAAAAERIRRAVAGEFQVQGHVLNVTCSIGISLFPDHGTDSETLIKNADVAMYCAKENGRNNFRFFTSELNAKAEERLALENSLRVALERGEFFLVYQPQVEIATGAITGSGSSSPLAPPAVGSGAARQVHTRGGRHRLDRSYRRMGAQNGLCAGASLAGPGSSTSARSSKRVSTATAAGPLRGGCSPGTRRNGPRPTMPRPGAHRKRAAVERREFAFHVAEPGQPGAAVVNRRLRYGIFQPQLLAGTSCSQVKN